MIVIAIHVLSIMIEKSKVVKTTHKTFLTKLHLFCHDIFY